MIRACGKPAPSPPLATVHGDLVYVEYPDRRRPFSAITWKDGHASNWDVDWCKRDGQLYYQRSGGGPVAPVALSRYIERRRQEFWASDVVSLVYTTGNALRAKEHRATPAAITRLGLVRLRLPKGNPFEDAIEDETRYCEVCDDHLPFDNPCEHEVP